MKKDKERSEKAAAPAPTLGDRHLRFGWWALLVFLTLGIVLEGLHAFKARSYMDVTSSTRRLMWTLSHAHGTLLALVNLAFAASLPRLLDGVNDQVTAKLRTASASLILATIMLPGGFFLGGVVFYGGDPGLGVLLVPPGALALLLAVFKIARASSTRA